MRCPSKQSSYYYVKLVQLIKLRLPIIKPILMPAITTIAITTSVITTVQNYLIVWGYLTGLKSCVSRLLIKGAITSELIITTTIEFTTTTDARSNLVKSSLLVSLKVYREMLLS